MKGKVYLYILTMVMAVAIIEPSNAQTTPAPNQWTPAATPDESAWVLVEDPSAGERIDVVVREGQIYVTTNRATQVKVVTILGQPVSVRNIPAGTMRMRLPLRGIYVLKVGETTRRINI